MGNSCVKLLTQSQLLCKRLLLQINRSAHSHEESIQTLPVETASLKNSHMLSSAVSSSKSSYQSTSRKRKTADESKLVNRKHVAQQLVVPQSLAAFSAKGSMNTSAERRDLEQSSTFKGFAHQMSTKRALSSRDTLKPDSARSSQGSERCSPAGTRLKIHQQARPFSRESSKERVRDTSSNESLERIHTFALKTQFQPKALEDSKGAYGGETP